MSSRLRVVLDAQPRGDFSEYCRSWMSITSGRRKIAPSLRRGSDPLNQMDGSGRSRLSTLFSGRLLATPVLDLGFTHSSYNNRPMQR